MKQLQTVYGDVYTESNVLISGTHTHSGPAGFFQYVLYEVMFLQQCISDKIITKAMKEEGHQQLHVINIKTQFLHV